MRERATLFDDAVEFMRNRGSDGDPIALVSNCAEDTRPLLAALGVAEFTEVWVLSCEVGAAKPDRAIFDLAVSTLGVRPDDAVFVDDDPDYCAGARSIGITSVLLSRHDDADATQQPIVRSFSEVTAALRK